MSYRPQEPTFNPSGINVMARRQPSINISGQAEIKLSPLDINVNDGALIKL